MRVDLTDDRTAKRVAVVGGVLLVVVVALVVKLLIGDDAEQGGSKPEQTRSAEPTVTPSETEEASGPGKAPKQAQKVAEKAVVALNEFSWQDEGHLSFLDALKPYATQGVLRMYRNTFGHDDTLDYQWSEDVVATMTDQKAKVTSSTAKPGGGEEWEFSVAYTTQTRQDGGPWGDPTDLTMRVTVAKTSAGWKMSALPEVGDQPAGNTTS